MKQINCWNDLRPYGIDCLTGEADHLMYRLLCDLTKRGKRIIERALGLQEVKLQEAWNRGDPNDPSIGSIMLPLEMLNFLAIFAMLESGFEEVLLGSGGVIGLEASDSENYREQLMKTCGPMRRFRYHPTTLDRNQHQMSGRVV